MILMDEIKRVHVATTTCTVVNLPNYASLV